MTAEDAVDLLARLIGGMTNGGVIGTRMLKAGGMNLLATTREVDVAILDVLNGLTGMFLGLLRGVGVCNVGLKGSCIRQLVPGKAN